MTLHFLPAVRSSDLEASHLFLRQRLVVVAGDADGDARHRRPQIDEGRTAQAAGGGHLRQYMSMCYCVCKYA